MNDQLDPRAQIDARAAALESKVIAWRRDLHQHPELSNREVRTAGVVAGHLQALGLKVQTGVAHTGVVGLLDTGRPGPVIALRADMDALPVTEEVDVPFASTSRANFNGQEVGVMHACGHDCHVAILMGVAELLAGMKSLLAGSIKFIFQPAEEGPPPGEEGGAALMIRQGVLENPKPDVIFGLHVFAGVEAGTIAYRPGPAMASSDRIRVTVTGRQTHGALPWRGVDPIVISSQIVLGLQTIVSRQVDVSLEPAVVSIGAIKGGVRDNIIPDAVEMLGTVRTFNEDMRADIHARIRNTVEMIARSGGASAQVHFDNAYPVTVNDIPLDRTHGADSATGGGRRQSLRRPENHRLRGFFVLSAEDSGLLLFPRHHAHGAPTANSRPRIIHRVSSSMNPRWCWGCVRWRT